MVKDKGWEHLTDEQWVAMGQRVRAALERCPDLQPCASCKELAEARAAYSELHAELLVTTGDLAALREQGCETCRHQDQGYCDNSAINIEGAGWVRVTCEAFGNGCRAWARREP